MGETSAADCSEVLDTIEFVYCLMMLTVEFFDMHRCCSCKRVLAGTLLLSFPRSIFSSTILSLSRCLLRVLRRLRSSTRFSVMRLNSGITLSIRQSSDM